MQDCSIIPFRRTSCILHYVPHHMASNTTTSVWNYLVPRFTLEIDNQLILVVAGDAFLKYLSTIYVFVTNPTFSEGALHSERQQLISNKSLFRNARHKGLPAYIQSKPFTPRSWHPPNFVLPAPEKNTTGKSSNVEEEEGYMTPVSDRMQLGPSDAGSKTSTSKGMGNAGGKKKRKTGEDIQWLSDKVIFVPHGDSEEDGHLNPFRL